MSKRSTKSKINPIVVVAFVTLIGTVVAAVLSSPILLALIQRTPSPSPSTPLSSRQVLEKVSFDYDDTPDVHGWDILDLDQPPPPAYRHILPGFVGKALEISSYEGKAMDHPVSPAAGFGTMIEYVIKPEQKTIVYAKIKAVSKNNTASKDIWLAFVLGAQQPERIYDGGEWTVYVVPQQLGNGWLKYQIDLKDVVAKTIGTDGWNLEKILAFRLRGNLSIASITVYE